MNTKKSLYLVIVPLVSLLIVCVLLIMTNIAIKAQTVNSPRILASYQHNTIGFEEFTANTNLSFEIYSSPDGDLLHAETLHTDSTGFAYFRGWSSFDIQVGQHIIANDGVTTKDLLVANVRYDVLDIDYDQARGIAPPGSQVGVYVHRLGDDHELSTQTGQNGTWVADFGADGQDILSYVSTNANTYDNDGDATIAWAPNFSVWNYAGFYVEGQSFTSGGMITVEIYDSLGGTLLYSAADIVAESDQGRFVIPFWQHLQNLQAGVHVVVIDQTSGEDRQLILQSLNLDIFDYETEVIQGTAPAGSTVFVHGGEHEIITEAGADNNWSVDFNTEGANLNPSDDVYVTLYDLD
ncbi:MAG TPA: hypothetical protein VLA49_02210, partial [Anaerolineales bacterium]|nr:hypothetical protein [Anaerolineales bacterium]